MQDRDTGFCPSCGIALSNAEKQAKTCKNCSSSYEEEVYYTGRFCGCGEDLTNDDDLYYCKECI